MTENNPSDPVAVYLREVDRIAPLTPDEQDELFRQLRHSDDWDEEHENIARRLIESHLRLVVQVAQRHSVSGFSMVDLLQEGNIGLMNALRSFAKNPSGDFDVYALNCIESAIGKLVNKSK